MKRLILQLDEVVGLLNPGPTGAIVLPDHAAYREIGVFMNEKFRIAVAAPASSASPLSGRTVPNRGTLEFAFRGSF